MGVKPFWSLQRLLCVGLLLATSGATLAQDRDLGSLIRGMPDVAQVDARYPASADAESRARRVAAYNVLIALVRDLQHESSAAMSDPRLGSLMGRYIAARDKDHARLSPDEQRSQFKQVSKLEHSKTFRAEVMQALLSPDWRQAHAGVVEDTNDRVARYRESIEGPPVTAEMRLFQFALLGILAVTILLVSRSSVHPDDRDKPFFSGDGRAQVQYGYSVVRDGADVRITWFRSRMGVGERLLYLIGFGLVSGLIFIGLGELLFDPKTTGPLPVLTAIALTFWLPALYVYWAAGYRTRPGRLIITPTEILAERNLRGDLGRYERAHVRSLILHVPGEDDREGGYTRMYAGSHMSVAIHQGVRATGEAIRQWGKSVQRRSLACINLQYAENKTARIANCLTPERAEALFEEVDRILTHGAAAADRSPAASTTDVGAGKKAAFPVRRIATWLAVPLTAALAYWLSFDQEPAVRYGVLALGALAGFFVARMWKIAVVFAIAVLLVVVGGPALNSFL